MKHFESFWLLSTEIYHAGEIRNQLKDVIDSNDKLFVAKLSGNWASYNVKKSSTDSLKNESFN